MKKKIQIFHNNKKIAVVFAKKIVLTEKNLKKTLINQKNRNSRFAKKKFLF